MVSLDPFPRLTESVGKYLSNPRVVILSVVLSKVFLDRVYNYAKIANPNAKTDSEGNETLDVLEYYYPTTSAEVYGHLSSYGPKGRMAYQSMLVYDSAFLLSRTIVLCLLMYYAFRSAPKWARPGVWIPVATTIFDLIENTLIYALIAMYPRRLDILAQVTAYAIMWKWFWLWATVASLCIGLLAGIYYGFHGLLAESVLMERDKEKRDMAKRHLSAAMQRAKETQDRVRRENSDKTKKDR